MSRLANGRNSLLALRTLSKYFAEILDAYRASGELSESDRDYLSSASEFLGDLLRGLGRPSRAAHTTAATTWGVASRAAEDVDLSVFFAVQAMEGVSPRDFQQISDRIARYKDAVDRLVAPSSTPQMRPSHSDSEVEEIATFFERYTRETGFSPEPSRVAAYL